MAPKREDRAGSSSSSELQSEVQSELLGSSAAYRVKTRQRATKKSNHSTGEASSSPQAQGMDEVSAIAARLTNRRRVTRVGSARITTGAAPARVHPHRTPPPTNRWRRAYDPNTPQELRAVNKSPGET